MQTVAMPEAVASLHFIFAHTLSAGESWACGSEKFRLLN
jgi:hypothetical protein